LVLVVLVALTPLQTEVHLALILYLAQLLLRVAVEVVVGAVANLLVEMAVQVVALLEAHQHKAQLLVKAIRQAQAHHKVTMVG
jgi:hypothetical protein